MDFSSSGKLLVVGCDYGKASLFDPVTQRHIKSIKKAHNDNVNSVKFMDDRMFATCSDDMTIAVWDVRNLNKSVAVLKDHQKWVKCLGYLPKNDLLVSTAFDGSVYTWNMKNYSEDGGFSVNSKISIDGILRTTLSPDSSKLIISMTNGILMVISNLDFETLPSDIQGFTPKLYRNMQITGRVYPGAINHTRMFHRERNRIEFIVDFPRMDRHEVLSSIQVHPKGWNVSTRNVAVHNESEWTCVHDIQDVNKEHILDYYLHDGPERFKRCHPLVQYDLCKQIPYTNGYTLPNVEQTINEPSNFQIHKNTIRLTHFIEESSVGKGLIKEHCYSRDGRIIGSPFGRGIRLLSFSPDCEEFPSSHPKWPGSKLHVVSLLQHNNSDKIICTKFSPTCPLLVSGCFTGEIVWFQPIM